MIIFVIKLTDPSKPSHRQRALANTFLLHLHLDSKQPNRKSFEVIGLQSLDVHDFVYLYPIDPSMMLVRPIQEYGNAMSNANNTIVQSKQINACNHLAAFFSRVATIVVNSMPKNCIQNICQQINQLVFFIVGVIV